MDYDFPKEIPPGILTSTLELKSKENKTFELLFQVNTTLKPPATEEN
jgi:hypothetical protein